MSRPLNTESTFAMTSQRIVLCLCTVWRRLWFYFPFFFFFSSRRRHTRSYGDWSSDVCSSDLRFSFQQRVTDLVDSLHPPLEQRCRKENRHKFCELGRLQRHAVYRQPSSRPVDRSEERRVGKECRSRWGRAQ